MILSGLTLKITVVLDVSTTSSQTNRQTAPESLIISKEKFKYSFEYKERKKSNRLEMFLVGLFLFGFFVVLVGVF